MAQRVRTVIVFFMCFSLSRSTCHSTLDTRPFLLDHLIRSYQHIRRNRQADLLCRLEVDDELELRRLLHGQVGGLGAFQNLVDENGGSPEKFGLVGSVRHQATALSKISPSPYRRQPMFSCQAYDLFEIRVDEPARRYGECGATCLCCLFKGTLEIACIAYLHGMKLQAQFSRR